MTGSPAKTYSARSSAAARVLSIAVEVGGPALIFYVLHACGVSDMAALVAGSAAPCLVICVRLARERRLDMFGVYVLGTIVLGIVASAISGSPRLLLARESWLTGASGVWFFVSLGARQPLAFLGARIVLEKGETGRESWDAIWVRDARFRRIWRVSTVIWGAALCVDAGVRVALATTLPIDVVPGLMTAVSVATMVILQPINGVYYFHAGLWDILRSARIVVPRGASTGSRPPYTEREAA